MFERYNRLVDFLKGIGGKVVGGVVLLGVVVAGIAFYQAGPEGRATFFDSSGKILGWTLIVVLAPWALFWLVHLVARGERSTPVVIAVILVGGAVPFEILAMWRMSDSGVAGGYLIAFGLGALVVNAGVFWLVIKGIRPDTNAAAASLVAGITLPELLALWWMFGFGMGGPLAITFFVVGALLAAVYNLLACDWIADRLVG